MPVAPPSQIIYRAAVIGAGPAGIACLGNLLDRLAPSSTDQILWIDPQFKAGRLDSYPAVPSNTKVCLFTKFARECQAFEAEKYSKTLEALGSSRQFDQQSGCELKWAGDLCRELTEHVLGHPRVHSVRGLVKELKRKRTDRSWSIKIEGEEVFQSQLVFLTTGSRPKSLEMTIPSIPLDDALNPTILSAKLSASECDTDTVAVYGSSHSAMLVLKNLLTIPNSPRRIINYYRQPAKFASFPDPINAPDHILHDNTGLKGETAEWVLSWINLKEEEFDEMFKGKLKRIKTSSSVKSANDCVVDLNIYAVGYERNPLPTIILNDLSLNSNCIEYTPTGQLTRKEDSIPIDGLFGYGIAFPERVKDLDGTPEMAVGMWKFMKHIKKCISQIVQ